MIGMWHPLRALLRAYQRSGLETTHYGHLDVHQNQIKHLLLERAILGRLAMAAIVARCASFLSNACTSF